MIDTNITMINADKLVPHPNNPRKDIGDVTELAESIKANGIMQNLTVVPMTDSDCYMVLIGHRRLAAAKQAGLTAVPCVIAANLSDNEQVGIMLAENMQRADLTAMEQAEGIQMMLDLGDTVSGISDKTGLSETTIRRRQELLKYDKEQVVQSFERGGNLDDYQDLKRVKSLEKQKELVKYIGTPNFGFKLDLAVRDEENAEKLAELEEFLSTFAEKVDKIDYSEWYLVREYSANADDKAVYPDNYSPEKKYCYIIYGYGYHIGLYTECEAEEDPEEQAAEEKRETIDRLRRERFNDIKELMKERRKAFVCDFMNVRKCTAAEELRLVYRVIELLIRTEANGVYYREISVQNFANIFDFVPPASLEADKRGDYITDKMAEANPSGARKLLMYIYAKIERDYTSLVDFHMHYRKDSSLNAIYDILEVFGFELSDEEKAILDGTHELYVKEDEED